METKSIVDNLKKQCIILNQQQYSSTEFRVLFVLPLGLYLRNTFFRCLKFCIFQPSVAIYNEHVCGQTTFYWFCSVAIKISLWMKHVLSPMNMFFLINPVL